MSNSRKSARSRRVLAATALLITAVLVAAGAIAVSTVPVLVGATIYGVVAGIVSSRLIANDLGQMRRDWAKDRADIANHNRLQAVARSKEHTAFAEQMSSRIKHKDAQIETLRDSLVTAEIDLAKTRERVSAERARVDALTADLSSAQSDVESARSDLMKANDALAASEAAEIQARAEVVAWEQSATDDQRRQHQRPA
ncbi:chromosome segregation ATPase [Aeromicrobium panaciterrae]|uniref:Chromosome segregation ATPase n=1 Tax=Aeromicrobium panaciterrae TaxID=363861 RepID=A0ABU1UM41_9ACTN|nr:hypothetical protein [Aeromicrobium panaciterrae]MDR7086247.1 chromosome segregation ATPase [Aeromicrobium panaciterrae]